MKVTVAPGIWCRLNAPQLAVVNAMANKARVHHWMVEARAERQPGIIRSTYVQFARAAHRAYLKDIKRAVHMAKERL